MAKSEKIMVLWILIVVVGLLGFAIVQIPDLDSGDPAEDQQTASFEGAPASDRMGQSTQDPFEDIFGEDFGAKAGAGSASPALDVAESPGGTSEDPGAAAPGNWPDTAPVEPIAERGETAEPKKEPVTTRPPASKPVTQPSDSADYAYYEVRPGDTYSKIALELYGSSRLWPEIQKANEDVDADSLPVGRRILVPKKSLLSQDTVARNDREPLSRRTAVSDQRSVGGGTYTVQKGDTFYSIARRFGTSVDRLFEMNRDRIQDPTSLPTGLALRVP